MTEGIDYSFSRPGGAAIAASGKKFAVRYLNPDGQGGKGLDASELADLRAHGIAVPVVFESTSSRALAGRAAGQTDARTAQGQLDALGMGALPVYFAVDFNATQPQMVAIDQYLSGAGEVLGTGRVGVYGGLAVVQHVQGSKTARWFWQTYAWSAGRTAAGIHLYQYLNGQKINGGAVDFCRSMTDEYGQHPAGTTTRRKVTPMLNSAIRTPDGSIYAQFEPGCPFLPISSLDEWNGYAAASGAAYAEAADDKTIKQFGTSTDWAVLAPSTHGPKVGAAGATAVATIDDETIAKLATAIAAAHLDAEAARLKE